MFILNGFSYILYVTQLNVLCEVDENEITRIYMYIYTYVYIYISSKKNEHMLIPLSFHP